MKLTNVSGSVKRLLGIWADLLLYEVGWREMAQLVRRAAAAVKNQ